MPIVFQAQGWQIAVVLSLCAMLATMILTKELRRTGKKRLGLRLGLSVIATLALALLGLEPACLVQTPPKKIALLTDTMSSELMDSLIETNTFEIFSLNPNPRATHIQDAGVLARNFPTSELHIFGDGLEKADLTRLRGRQLSFRQSELPKGIVDLQTIQSLTLGDILRVKGLVRGTFQRLVFRANEMLIDSLSNLHDETPFEFSFTPKQLGKQNLSLVLDGKEEMWGVYVLPAKPLSILVLQAKPTFEIKYLKNFLTERGYRFAMRIKVGKERYREEFWNMQSQSLAPISRKTLSRFDVVMIDAETLASLTPLERTALEKAIAQEGLGVFITERDSVLLRVPSLRFFQPFRFRMHQAREQSIRWNQFESPPISLDAVVIQPDFGVQSLLEDSDGCSVAAFHQKGFGRIAISLVENAYQWRLEGKTNVYAAYWAHLFSAIAKRANETAIQVPSISIVHEPIEFQIQTVKSSPHLFIQEGSQETFVPLRQEVLNPTVWRGRYWASGSGWIAFKANSGEAFWAFISDETMFESLRKERRRKETLKAVQHNSVEPQSAEMKHMERDTGVRLLCALCLMLAIAGLWAERKV